MFFADGFVGGYEWIWMVLGFRFGRACDVYVDTHEVGLCALLGRGFDLSELNEKVRSDG